MDVPESELASIKGRSPREKGVNEFGTDLEKLHRKPRTLPYWHTDFMTPSAEELQDKMLYGPRSPPGENIHDWTDWSRDRIGVFEHNDSVNTMAISTPFARRWAKLKQKIGRL